jgi:hypothetical protein
LGRDRGELERDDERRRRHGTGRHHAVDEQDAPTLELFVSPINQGFRAGDGLVLCLADTGVESVVRTQKRRRALMRASSQASLSDRRDDLQSSQSDGMYACKWSGHAIPIRD